MSKRIQCPNCGSFRYSVLSGPVSSAEAKQYRYLLMTKIKCFNCNKISTIDLMPSVQDEYEELIFKSILYTFIGIILIVIGLELDGIVFRILALVAGIELAVVIVGFFVNGAQMRRLIQEEKEKKGIKNTDSGSQPPSLKNDKQSVSEAKKVLDELLAKSQKRRKDAC